MQRLVYAPRVEAHIRLERYNKLIDVTDDIITGNVARRVNAMSTAQLVLQNKNGKYTGKQKIEPMDRIVIRMSRIGTPFLVFSGFVDDAPYDQLYPGPVTIDASCSLKLLQHTYFDPGLPTFYDFFQKLGWNYNPASGVLTSNAGAAGNDDLYGGIGDIIYEVLREVGNWPAAAIDIRDLPTDFVGKIAKMMQAAAKESDENWEESLKMLEKLYGVKLSKPVGGPSVQSSTQGGSYSGAQGNVALVDIARSALKAGFKGEDAVKIVAVAAPESGGRSDAMNYGVFPGSPTPEKKYHVGLWQISSIHYSGGGGNNLPGPPGFPTGLTPSGGRNWRTMKMPQDWKAASAAVKADNPGAHAYIEALFDPDFNAEEAYKLYTAAGGLSPWEGQATAANLIAAREAVRKAVLAPNTPSTTTPADKPDGPGSSNDRLPTDRVDPYARQDTSEDTFVFPIYPKSGSYPPWSPGGEFHASRPGGRLHAGNDLPGTTGKTLVACVNGEVVFSGWSDGGGNTVSIYNAKMNKTFTYMHCNSTNVKAGQTVKQGQTVGTLGSTGTDSSGPHLHFQILNGKNPFASPAQTAGGAVNPTPFLKPAFASAQPVPVDSKGYAGATGGASGNASSSESVSTSEEVASIARAAIFTLQLQSTDIALSNNLTLKRALANDIPLMTWINELIPASGRVYTSKPNGEFLSFYPDYFGYFARTPYFRINDIEILDLTINKNDTELVTHVFTVGSMTIPGAPGFVDQLGSMYASIEEPSFDFFVNLGKNDPENDPITFMRKFGARPMTQTLPQVNHPMLLWMAGWMKFAAQWAKRYRADASFTFMPEILPGGLVALGDRLQMYVEGVTHSFDMAGGFSTSAQLSSPAALDKNFLPGLVKAGGSLFRGDGGGDRVSGATMRDGD